jgi:hypothetical protein
MVFQSRVTSRVQLLKSEIPKLLRRLCSSSFPRVVMERCLQSRGRDTHRVLWETRQGSLHSPRSHDKSPIRSALRVAHHGAKITKKRVARTDSSSLITMSTHRHSPTDPPPTHPMRPFESHLNFLGAGTQTRRRPPSPARTLPSFLSLRSLCEAKRSRGASLSGLHEGLPLLRLNGRF